MDESFLPQCPLLGEKQTLIGRGAMSVFDPKRTKLQTFASVLREAQRGASIHPNFGSHPANPGYISRRGRHHSMPWTNQGGGGPCGSGGKGPWGSGPQSAG